MSALNPDPNVSAWDLVQPWDMEAMGEEILDVDERKRWERAFKVAGGLPYIWSQLARPISEITYGLLELKPGDRVLIIGEAIEPAGWVTDMEAIVGSEGHVDAVEIIRDGRAAIQGKKAGRNGVVGCWEWKYTYDTPDEHYDCVACLQSTQHCDDWDGTSKELLRVMKPGRRIVLAESVLGGATFKERINADLHLRAWHEKLFTTTPLAGIPYYSPESLEKSFGSQLEDLNLFDWKGVEMLWGRKPA